MRVVGYDEDNNRTRVLRGAPDEANLGELLELLRAVDGDYPNGFEPSWIITSRGDDYIKGQDYN